MKEIEGYQRVTLANLNEGVAEEVFAREWDRVLENIQDPNTDPEAKRVITLKIEVKADEPRRNALVTVVGSSKLSAMRGVARAAAIGVIDGERVAVQTTARQMGLFDESPPAITGDNVSPFTPHAGKE